MRLRALLTGALAFLAVSSASAGQRVPTPGNSPGGLAAAIQQLNANFSEIYGQSPNSTQRVPSSPESKP